MVKKKKILAIKVEFYDFDELDNLGTRLKKYLTDKGGPYGMISKTKKLGNSKKEEYLKTEFYLKYENPTEVKEKDGLLVISSKVNLKI